MALSGYNRGKTWVCFCLCGLGESCYLCKRGAEHQRGPAGRVTQMCYGCVGLRAGVQQHQHCDEYLSRWWSLPLHCATPTEFPSMCRCTIWTRSSTATCSTVCTWWCPCPPSVCVCICIYCMSLSIWKMVAHMHMLPCVAFITNIAVYVCEMAERRKERKMERGRQFKGRQREREKVGTPCC